MAKQLAEGEKIVEELAADLLALRKACGIDE